VLCWIGIFFLLFATHGDMAARKLGLLPMPPTVAYLVVSLPVCAYLIFRELRGNLSPILEVFRQNSVILVPFTLMAALALIWSVHPTAYWGAGGTFILLPMYGVIVLAIAMVLPLLRVVRRCVPALAIGALAVLLVSILADVLEPGLFSKHAGRPAGLPANANTAAFLLLVVGSVLLEGKRTSAFKASVLGAMGAGVVSTLSRGGILLFVLVLLVQGGYALAIERRALRFRMRTLVVGALGLVAALSATASLVGRDLGTFSHPGVQERIEELASGHLVATDDIRFALAREYIGRISEAPIVGHGTAFSHRLPKGPHNLFLEEWVNCGMIGLGAYVCFLACGLALFIRRRSRVGVTLMLLIVGFSFLSHTVLESRAVLLILGMVATLTLSAPASPGTRSAESASCLEPVAATRP